MQKSLVILLFIPFLWVGCKKTATDDTTTTTSKNEFYFIKDGVKYDLSSNASVYTLSIGKPGIIGGDYANIHLILNTSFYASELTSGFPRTFNPPTGSSELTIGTSAATTIFHEPVRDPLNTITIENAIVQNNWVVYIKGSFKMKFAPTSANPNRTPFWIEGRFNIDKR